MDEAGTLYPADCVVIATGGLAYPLTGSTGDGYELARQAGHRTTPTYPSLISLEAYDPRIPSLQGLSLKNVKLTARLGKKTLYSGLGEMMFTHYGITGPLVLTLSALLPEEGIRDVAVRLDLKPGLTEDQLKRRIQREFDAHAAGSWPARWLSFCRAGFWRRCFQQRAFLRSYPSITFRASSANRCWLRLRRCPSG